MMEDTNNMEKFVVVQENCRKTSAKAHDGEHLPRRATRRRSSNCTSLCVIVAHVSQIYTFFCCILRCVVLLLVRSFAVDWFFARQRTLRKEVPRKRSTMIHRRAPFPQKSLPLRYRINLHIPRCRVQPALTLVLPDAVDVRWMFVMPKFRNDLSTVRSHHVARNARRRPRLLVARKRTSSESVVGLVADRASETLASFVRHGTVVAVRDFTNFTIVIFLSRIFATAFRLAKYCCDHAVASSTSLCSRLER